MLGKCDESYLEKNLILENVNKKEIVKSHFLFVIPTFKIMIGALSKYYPDNIFTYKEQSKLVIPKKKGTNDDAMINEKIFEKGMNKIKDGETVKLFVFSKQNLNFSGHSLLIKKVSENNFILFDPSYGEYRGLTFKQLKNQIDQQLMVENGTDLLFIKGSDYLKRLGIKK